MAVTKKGWGNKIMFSAYKKEATYDAGVPAMSDANACSMKGFDAEITWPDIVGNDKEHITGTEHGTTQVIEETRCAIKYSEKQLKPNTLAFIAGLCMGSITTTQDAALTAYKHKIIPVTVGTAIPSCKADALFGGIQYNMTGIKGKSFKLSGEEKQPFSLEAELLGSGTRAVSATAFASSITESWMLAKNCSVWLESAANISISASLVQAAEDISSATPEALKTRIKKFEFTWDNDAQEQAGFGGLGVLQDIDYGRRKAGLSFTLLADASTELDYYLNQDIIAVEFDCKGALIAATGAMYYGFHLIIPKYILKTPPIPKGGAGDILTIDMEGEVYDDGTNPAAIIEVYNAKAAYLAA